MKLPAMASSLLIFFTLLLLTTNIVSSQATEPRYPAIFVFGDSTSDTGTNNCIPTAFKSNHPPYGRNFPNSVTTGRFSNGRLVPDLLASSLGIKEFVPPYLSLDLSENELRTGVSFASAGSGLDDLTTLVSGVIPVSKQPNYFLEYKERLKNVAGEEEAMRIVNGGLVLISAGSNDLLFDFYAVPARRLQFNISGYQDFLQQRLEAIVKELYDLGCRNFAIAGLGPIGCVPIEISTKYTDPASRRCLDEVNLDARLYNAKLEKLMAELEASLQGSKMLYGDVYNPTMDLINNPEKHGFIETSRGCCGTGFVETGPLCNELTPVCANASEYLFWDAVHPSEAAYLLVTESFMENTFH